MKIEFLDKIEAMKSLLPLFLLSLITASCGNSNKQTVQNLKKLIQRNAAEGQTIVRFPNGKWQWHSAPTERLVGEPEELKLSYPKKTFGTELLVWVKEHQPKAVFLQIPNHLPAKAFFDIETILSAQSVAYWLASDNPAGNTISITESDGVAVSF